MARGEGSGRRMDCLLFSLLVIGAYMPYKCMAQSGPICNVAGSLDTILLNLGKTPHYLVTETDVNKRLALEAELKPAVAIDDVELTNLNLQSLVELGAMVNLLQANMIDTRSRNSVEIRVTVERLVLSTKASSEAALLAPVIGLMSATDVMLLCEDVSFNELALPVPDVEEGCYSSSGPSEVRSPTLDTVQCLAVCRSESYLFTIVDQSFCACSGLTSELGRREGGASSTGSYCDNAAHRHVLYTGLGYPTEVYQNPSSQPSNVSHITEFNSVNIGILDGVAIDNNTLLGMKEVVFPSSLDRFFVAVYDFSVALFKLNKAEDGALTYTYIQHFRWDGANFVTDSKSWIMTLDQSSSNFLNAPTKSNPAELQRASWFAIVPMFVKQTANLYSTDTISFNDADFSNNLAGLPYPGGLWIQQLVILHEDLYTNFVNVNLPQVTALRLSDGRLEQLHTVTSDQEDGAFFMRDQIQKNAVSTATKLFGRRSLLLIGSRNDEAQVSYVEGFELSEQRKEYTAFASYGQVHVERRLRVSGNSITAIEVAELSKSYLLVLDRATKNGGNSRLRVLKFVDIETVEQVDEKVFTDKVFTKMNFYQANGKSYVLLISDSDSATVQINHRGHLIGNLLQITSEPSSVSVVPFNYGWLKSELGFASLTYKSDDGVCNFQIYSQTADEVLTAAKTVPCDNAPQAMTVLYEDKQAIFIAGESYRIDAFSYMASILPSVDQSSLRNIEWDTMQNRIESMVTIANDNYASLSASKDLYLLKSGSVINDSLVLENLLVTETISLPAGSLANTNLNFNLKTSEESTLSLDYGSRINIALANVETALDTAENNLKELLNYPDNALLKSTTGTQYISSLAVSNLHSDSIGFFGEDIHLNVTTFKSGDVTETFDHLIGDLYTKDSNLPVSGSKSFQLLSASSLDTQILSDGSLTISTENILLKSGDQSISANQTFNLPVSIGDVELKTDAGFESYPVIINVEDLEENNAATGFRGSYNFANTVNAPNISAVTKTSGSIDLDDGIMSEIALTTDESVLINGKLIVNLAESAIGSCILVKDGIINNIKFKDLADNTAATHCSSVCIGKEVNFMENIKIEGNVEFKQDFDTTMINTIPVEDYVKQVDFSEEDFLVTGKKTLMNTLSAAVVSSGSFNGYTLDKLITLSTNQDITGFSTFHNNVSFAAIAGSDEDLVPLTDGQNFLALFRSDLNAVRDKKPWIEEPLTSSFEFTEIDIVNAPVEVSSLFNGMNIAENLDQVILSTDQAVEVGGIKTFNSAVDLTTVVVEKVTNGGEEYTMSDIVNDKVPSEISGVKTFTKSVTMNDVFMVDTAKVNDIDFSEVLSCFVNINADTNAIVIESPVYFDSIVTSDFSLEMNSDLPSVVCPADISLEAAWRLLENKEFDEIPIGLKDEVLRAAGINIDPSSSDADIALDAMFGYYLLNVNSEPQFSVDEVNDMNQEEMKLAMHLKIQRTFGVSGGSLTDLQLVQRFCSCLQLNGICAQQDLVLNDADNEFCSPENNCVQYFNNGLHVDQLNVSGVIHMNPEYTIFDVDIDKLELERISLSRNQIWSGNYNFTEIRMEADGTYEGRVSVQHGDEVVDSVNYRSKFLNYKACNSTQTFTATKNLDGGLTAQTITANLLKVSDETVDLDTLYQNGLSTVEAESFENLVFADNVIYNGNIESHGDLDGINVVSLARDMVVQGSNIVVNDDLTVTGTDSAQITFNSVKVMSKAPEVGGKVVAFVENGEVYPTMVFKPCSRPSTKPGLLLGTPKNNLTVASLDECHFECRRTDCAGLSFNANTRDCRLMSISNQILTDPDYISISYSCWFQIRSTESSKYLSVDRTLGTLITITEPDSWRTVDDRLVHRSTGLAITSLTTESGITVELKAADQDNSKQRTNFTEAADFKIINTDSTYELKENDDGTVDLVSSNAEPTLWNAGYVGEKFSYVSEGVPLPRIFTKSTNQEIYGDLLVEGNVKFKGTLSSNTVGDLDVDSLAARYSYSTEDSEHRITGDLVLTGDLGVTELTAATFDTRVFESFLQDILPQSSDFPITVTGSKTFTNNVRLNNPNTQVNGDVVVEDTRIDLTALHSDTAFIDSSNLEFSHLNTFNKNEADSLKVDMRDELISYVGIQLNNPVMQNTEAVNLETLAEKTIPRVSEVPASVQGKVIFKKDVTGSRSVNIANVRATTGPSFSIPEDVVTVKDPTFAVSLGGKDRLFAGLSTAAGQELDIGGQLFGHTATDFQRVFYKDGDQLITGNLEFLEDVSVFNNVNLQGTLNSITPIDNFVFLSGATNMTGSFNFPGTLSVQKVDVSGNLNELDFGDLAANLFTRDTNQNISGEWSIMSDTTFDMDVVGNGVAEDGDGIINGQKVVDLKSVNHIYEKVQAVKLSAQAEAATMCEFVSDLQESYVLNQGIKQFDIHSTHSTDGANFSSTELVFSGGLDRLFVLAIDGTSLKVFEKKESTLEQRATIEIKIGVAETVPKGSLDIGLVLDLGEPESETFDLIVFVKTCIRYTSTLLYRLSGNANEASLSKVGELDEMKTVTKLGSELYSLGYTLTEGGHRVRIELLDTTELKSCADSCSDISRSTVWVGYKDHIEFPSFLNSQLEVVQHQDTYRVFAFNEINEGNEVATPRLLYVKITSQISDDSTQLTHSYEIVNLYNPIGPTGDFSLLSIHDKVTMVSADGLLRLDEIDVVNNATVNTIQLTKPEGRFTDIQKKLNFLGDFNMFTALRDDKEVVFLKYAGLQGLDLKVKLDSEFFIASLSSRSMVNNKRGASYLVLAGGNTIKLLVGLVHNPVTQTEFKCPAPEVSPSLVEPAS